MDTVRELPNGYRHIALGKIDSTNIIALEYLKSADPGKLWITAEQQTNGKGSRGRSWVSERGNLYASLLLRLDATPDKIATLTFVASLALYEVLVRFVPGKRLALKWPNDLLLDEAKVSGILLESHLPSNQDAGVIVGMGVNCVSSPSNVMHAATSIQSAGVQIEPEFVFKHLVVEMDKWLSIWDSGNNFATIRGKWLERSIGRGRQLVVKMANSRFHGIFEDIDSTGRLILKTPDGRCRTISVADIFFSNPK